jgi:hypothetical protein
VYILSSFRMERIGTATMTFAGFSVSVSSGRYAHLDLSSYDSACTSFAAALQAAAVTAGATNALVVYSRAAHTYTLSNGGGSFTITFGATTAGKVMQRILGFTVLTSTGASHTSGVRPYYVLVPAIDGRSRYTALRHEARSTRRQTDDGRGYVNGPTEPVYSGRWEHWHEPLAAVFAYAASPSAPWTWEHLWLHAGRWQEYLFIRPDADCTEPPGIWQLTMADFDESTHERQFTDGDFAWKIRLDATRLDAFTYPLELFGSSLKLWLDRSRQITYGTSPAVSAWRDLTTNANNASQSTAAQQPTVATEGLDFDGTNDTLSIADAASLAQTTALTLFFSIVPDVVTGNKVPVSKSASGGGSWSVQTNVAALRMHIGTPGSTFGEGGTMVASAPQRVVVVYDGTASGNANRLRMWLNGTQLSLSFTGTIPATISAGTAAVTLGAFSNAAQYFDGKTRCVGIADVVASAAEIASLNAYMVHV